MNEKCFAMKNGQCRALTGNCPGQAACKFYKPRWKLEKEQRLINRRLCGLPMEKQMQIADKYFSGEMPWRSGIDE